MVVTLDSRARLFKAKLSWPSIPVSVQILIIVFSEVFFFISLVLQFWVSII